MEDSLRGTDLLEQLSLGLLLLFYLYHGRRPTSFGDQVPETPSLCPLDHDDAAVTGGKLICALK